MCCRAAVERAYCELVVVGKPEAHARDAGVMIFRFHHPEVPLAAAIATVELWTRHPRLQ